MLNVSGFVAPAQEALENVHKVWGMGLGASKTIYQGEPSPEVDHAWEALYNGASEH